MKALKPLLALIAALALCPAALAAPPRTFRPQPSGCTSPASAHTPVFCFTTVPRTLHNTCL